MPLFSQPPSRQVIEYRVKVLGRLDRKWLNWFPGLEYSPEQAGDGQIYSVITIRDADQARLRGVIDRVWDLNLALISVERVLADTNENPPT